LEVEIIPHIELMLSQKQTLLVAAALGLFAVSFGAFGTHALKPMLTESGRLETYELAVRYHFYHTFAMLGGGILMGKYNATSLKVSALLFLIGTLLFSGSLYALCLLNISKLAIVTPFGGVFLITGWAALFITFLRSREN
jgi:uncharacterized membrane protein YgdD (TMEM256/DUF423 family)